MLGIVFSILAGAAMSFQGVINTRLGDNIGVFESNMFVQGTAFALACLAALFFGKGNLKEITQTNWVYLTGGVLGIIITVTVMLSIKQLSPTVAISVILISQLLVAAVIDAFGLLGAEKVTFTLCKYIGVGLMIAGVVVFKL